MANKCSITECTTAAATRGMCRVHYLRWRRNPDGDPALNRKSPGLDVRFWAKVNKGENCWEWTGARFPSGYGAIWHERRMHHAHRVSWTLAFGEIPDDLQVLHHCDNRPCIRPEHLFLGTHLDNMTDKARKMRGPHLLNPQMVRTIRHLARAGYGTSDIARWFNVTDSTALDAINRRTWRHVE